MMATWLRHRAETAPSPGSDCSGSHWLAAAYRCADNFIPEPWCD